MSDFYLPTRCIVLNELQAHSPQFHEHDETVSSLSDIPDTESITVKVDLEIGDFYDKYGGQDFSLEIRTGENRFVRAYRPQKENFAKNGWILLSTYNGEWATKVIEELVAQCDEGTLYSSMPKLRNYFVHHGYPYGPDV